MRMDSKVHGTLISNRTGNEISEDEFVVFRPHDNSFWPTLLFYRQQCSRDGAELEQLRAVDALIERVKGWRLSHLERCKVPDVDEGELAL